MNREVLAVFDKAPDFNNRLRLGALNNLALSLLDTNRPKEAQEYAREALERRHQSFGSDDPDTSYSMRTVALVLLNQGKLGAAEEQCRSAVRARQKSLGPDYVATLVSLNDLATILTVRGRLGEAKTIYQELIPKVRARLQHTHWQLAIIESCYGEFLLKSREFACIDRGCWESVYERFLAIGVTRVLVSSERSAYGGGQNPSGNSPLRGFRTAGPLLGPDCSWTEPGPRRIKMLRYGGNERD